MVLGGRVVLLAACCATVFAALAAAHASARRSPAGDYENAGMQCVSEFNWNQGTESSYKSATGYFVSSGGNIMTSPIPDCAGGWTAHNDTLILRGNKQPRMFVTDANGSIIMLDMSTTDVSWKQNVAQLGRNFNGAL
jgi:hypothetical protein